MTPSILTAAQEGLRLAEKATKGPWVELPEPYAAGIKSSLGTLICALGPTATKDEFLANRELIAHAGTHYADICRELLRLREVIRGVLDSATPHPIEHPTMFQAFAAARSALAQTGEEKT